MSYHIYTTDGIILKRTHFGEANVLVHILTEDFGLIMASAQAVRNFSSKLRPALQEFTHVSISCVKGKNGWKVTNAIEKNNFFFSISHSGRRVIAQIVSVILQMIPGESPHPEIFQTVRTGFEFLSKTSRSNLDVSNFECLIVLRILYHLGYVVSDSTTAESLSDGTIWNENILNHISNQKKVIVALINKALKASQL